jgi:amino acid adenylation domain-containing protein/non-ribosomal peptide synthase protein (TIGR01720 family)
MELLAAPASFAQQGLWYQAELEPGNPAYHVPVAVRMRGVIDADAIAAALQAIVDRHESLRTTFALQNADLVQLIHPAMAVPLRVESLEGGDDVLAARIHEEIHRPFDLVRGPLLRWVLFQRAAGEAVLLGTIHHLVTDGWSIGILTREFAAAYAGQGLPPLDLQYADYAEWQREQAGHAWTGQIAYWRQRLRGPLTYAEIAPDFPRTGRRGYEGGTERVRVPLATLERLRQLSSRTGATLFMTLLAAFKVLVYRHTHEADVVIGSPVANRNRAEIEDLIGFFVNMQVLRTDLGGAPTFLDVLARVKQTTLEAWENQDVPFETLTSVLQPDRTQAADPFYRVVFALQNAARGTLALPGMTIETLDVVTDTAKLALTFIMEENAEGLELRIEYSAALFTRETVRRLGRRYQRLLEEVVADPARVIEVIPMLAPDEAELLGVWGGSGGGGDATFPLRDGVHRWFEDAARRFGDRTAVRCDGQGLTYRELDARANRLARLLQARGVGPETLVGLCVERSIDLVVGILGILKAGGAYVPLDPSYPAERLRFFVEDSGLAVVVTHAAHEAAMRAAGASLVVLDGGLEEMGAHPPEPVETPVTPATPGQAAYVIYTSGSTGTPKGVVVTHGNVMRLMSSTEHLFGFDEHDVWTLFHSYAFDFSVWELWGPLLYGGCVVVVPYAISRTPEQFLQLLDSEGVTVLNQTPSAFYQLMAVDDGRALALRYVIFGGEALDVPRLRTWFDRHGDTRPRLVNMYGITETTVHVTYRPIGVRDTERPSSVIGRALGDLTAIVLDGRGALSPIGVAGELYVGGAGVARGYLRRDELTSARFIERDGERLYRTGDLVRWLQTGELEYLGRIDTQVKVRGFRIELGEIEHVLRGTEEVLDAVVILRPGPSDQQRLVAYVVPERGAAPTPAQLRLGCGLRLPDYMVPAAYVLLDALPLTANGKLDRAALPDPDSAGHVAHDDYVAPRNEVEEKLARVWKEVLRLERAGVHDNFFALGGDSILLLQAAAKCSRAGVKLTRRQLVEHQTIAALAALVPPAKATATPAVEPTPPGTEAPPARVDARDDAYALTPLQEGLLFHAVYAPGDGVYVEQLHGTLDGELDAAAFERAWQAVVTRHPILRSTFAWNDGQPRQRVLPDATLHLVTEDWRDADVAEQQRRLEARVDADRRRGFDLAQAPLMRIAVMRLNATRWQWLWTHHHLVLDGWCLSQLVGEVLECYRAYHGGTVPQLPERRPFRDYIDWLARQDAAAAEAYWREALAGFSTPSRIDAPPPGSHDAGPAEQDFVLSAADTARLNAWARQVQITPSTIVTAAWAMLVRAYAGTDDVVFGVTVSGRPAELTGFELMIGPFINTLPLRVRVDPEAPLDAWLRDVHRRQSRMREFEYSRLVDIQRWSDLPAGTPLFDSLMVFENYPVDASLREQQSGLQFGPVTFVERSTYGLALAAIPGETLRLRLYFDPARVDRTTVTRMLAQLGTLLESAATGSVPRVGGWSVLPRTERARLLTEWNETAADYVVDRSVTALFDAQVASAPDAVAVVFEGEHLTYRGLASRADRLAAWLRRRGAGLDVLVGVQIERSIEMLVAVLAVWKAGAAYVPLDPSYPEKRLAHMRQDAGARLVLTRQTVLDVLREEPDVPADVPADDAAEDAAAVEASLDGLAYVIYTSGSTGLPKGTLVTHRGLTNLAQAQSRAFDVRPGDRVLQFASLSFDASVSEIVMALCFGATLHLATRDDILPGEPFVDLLRDRLITHLTIPPSVLAALPHVPLPHLRTLIVAGEACPASLAETWSSGRRFVNAYGPTENTVCATIGAYEGHALTIGRPMTNVRIYILDRDGDPVPIGATGELYIGGAGVARGYGHRPALTAERFVPDPFSDEAGRRMYRSGDLARWLPDGTIDYLGRIDHQVKIRGHRIELEEIAQILRMTGDLRDAVVLAVTAPSGHPRLVAYVASGGRPVSAEGLRASCAEWLPDYMVPSAVVVLDALPLTPSGKLDRAALPDPDAPRAESHVGARNEAEAALARVWSDVLGVARVGVDDNFFALGGDSIVSLQVVSRAAQAGLQLTARELFQHPTVSALARVAVRIAGPPSERGPRAATAPGAPASSSGPIPLTPIQQWFFEQELVERDRWNQAVLVEVAASVTPDALEGSLLGAVRHHDALRTRFRRAGHAWELSIAGGEGIVVERIVDGDMARHAERAHASLSLADGPIARALHFVPERRLLVVIHHLAIDGVSWRVLFDDVERLLNGDRLEPAAQFADWARRLAERARSGAIDVEYWRALPPPPARQARPENTAGTVHQVEARLSLEETETLLRRVPAIHHTQVNDVLLAAFAASMREWTGERDAWVNLEGHGREPLFDDMDLSRVVGWFTSLYPVRLEVSSLEPGALLRSVREQLTRIPQNGVGFGIARYLAGDAALAALPEPEISFNYLGQLDHASAQTRLRLVDGPVGEGQSPREPRRHLVDVVASVRSGEFRIAWHYSSAVHEASRIEALAAAYMQWLRRLLASVQRLWAGATAGAPSVGADVEDLYALTPMQQGLLFHALQTAEPDLYLEQLHGELRGGVDTAAFERAWQEVTARHAIFRTAFVWEGVDEPLQRVSRRVEFRLDRHDWRDLPAAEQATRLSDYLHGDRRRGFALDRAPLTRVALIRLDEERWHWVWTHHHVLLDGWCLALVVSEVLRGYEAFTRGGAAPALPAVRPYRTYVEWLARQDASRAEAYWRQTLAGFTAPTRIRLADEASPGESGQIELLLTVEETQRVQAWTRRHHLTVNTLVTAAWARVLQAFSGSEDVVFGVTVSGRPASLPGSAEMIGLFINTLPLRVASGRGRALVDWLADVQQQQADLREYEYSRLVDVQRWSDLPPGEAVFDTLLAFDNYPVDRTLEHRFGPIEVHDVQLVERTHYPMTLSVVPHDAMRMRALYDPRRFAGSGVRRMLHALRTLLVAAVSDRADRVEAWSMVDTDDTRALLARAGTPSSQSAAPLECLHDWFSRTASARGDVVAVRCGEEQLTYHELEARSNRLANYLRARGVGAETLVGLRMERSIDLVTGIVGILKAGGAYVPLDPANPAERTAFMLRDSGVRIVVSEETFREEALVRASDARPAPGAAPWNAAYVIYTSGSTGVPKGCVVTHANVARLMRQTEAWYGFDDRDVWTLFHSVAFDFSVWEVWGALLYGGCLVVVPYAVSRSPEDFRDLLARERVTVLNQTPSAFRQLMAADEHRTAPLALRYVIFGGEALQIDALAPWFDRHGDQTPRLVNMYGITETTVHVTYRVITRADLAAGTGSRIGVPIPDLQLYVLDHHRQLVPEGLAGELYVAGAGVARGYLGRPELTAQRMVPNPFGEGRLYRTGDLVRWRGDGLEYLGRIDDQVKIRGFRIELGEIESVLASHPAVRECVVLMRDERLVAYVVGRAAAMPGEVDGVAAASLRGYAAARLPDYMLPAAFVVLAAMPLTSNGKIHRAALPEPAVAMSDSYVAPRTERERVLAEVWSEVLGVPSVGVHDNFFALGGDSIRSIQILSRARARGIELTFQDLFEHPTIAELTGGRAAAAEERTAPFSLVSEVVRARLPADVEDAYPLTRLQQGMFFHADAYHDVMSYHLRAPLVRAALVGALGDMTQRHAVLRTSVDLVSYDEPLQLVHRAATIPFAESSEDWVARERTRPLDPARAPLLRVHVRDHGDGTFRFEVSFHHAILDGWSLATLLTELFQCYLARLGRTVADLPPRPDLEFRDFVALERRVAADPAARAFWTSFLDGAEFTPLPRVTTRHRVRTVRRQAIDISETTSRRLRQLADAAGVPMRSVLLAAHGRALAHIAGRDDVVTGLVTNGRPESGGGDRMVGLFLNTVPFRLSLERGTWMDLIRETFRTEQRISWHRRFPLGEIQKACGGVPLFETDFNFVHFHVFDQLRGVEGVESLGAEAVEETNFAIAVNFSWWGDPARLSGSLDYDSSELTASQMASYGRAYAAILDAMAARPDESWSARALAETGPIAPLSASSTLLHELVADAGAALAVTSDDEVLSYEELHRRANRLAHALRERGVGPDVLVGVALEAGVQRIVALLAVLKAGGAYLPIDPEYPPHRVALMVEDSGIVHAITRAGGLPVPHAIDIGGDYGGYPDTAPMVTVHPDNLAYALYTSGSTGRPKGVLIPHRAIVNHMRWMQEVYPLGPDDRVFQKTPFSFDASVWEFWAPLCAGAQMYAARPGGAQDAAYLVETIRAQGLTILQVVPALLDVMLDHPEFSRCESLRRVFAGGEPLTLALVRRFREALPRAAIVNLYGPTEATIDATSHLVGTGDDAVPIGIPIRDVRAYVLDRRLQPAPLGTDGELYLGGIALGRGYHRRAALTAERFLADPFSPEPGRRMYRTGDVVRRLPDGTLEFRDRADEQVKVRGHRVELGEVEAVLASHPAVQRAVAVVIDRRLVAYVSGAPADDLRAFMAERVPAAMIPSAFVHLPALPLTPSGKIDRRALPVPEGAPMSSRPHAEPVTDAERLLAGAWQSVLGVQQAGLDDNFFDVGGDSILSLQIVARLRRAGWKLSPRSVLEHQTIRRIAPLLEGAAPAAAADHPSGEVELLPIQRAFFARELANQNHWNQSTLLVVPDDFSFERFAEALQRVAAHHDALRLRFTNDGGTWRQRYVDGPALIPCQPIESTDIEGEAARIQGSLDITDGPTMRAAVFTASRRLLLVIHHLVVDAVSWRILLEDLAAAYQGRALPPATSSLRAWSERLQAHTPSGAYWDALHGRLMPRLPVDADSGRNTEADAATVHVTLDAPELLQTRASDALLDALADTLTAWIGSDDAWVDVEGHGREEMFDEVDLSRTVGWFTTIYPVTLRRGVRQLPERGIDFGLLHAIPGYHHLPPREISFNYLGRVAQGLSQAGFAAAPESAGVDRAPENARQYLIDVSARMEGHRLFVDWTYAGTRFRESTIARVAEGFVDALKRRLAAGIEEVLPLSPLQEGLLYHALDDEQGGVYVQQIAATLEGVPQPAAFERAWNRVLARHAALRASFRRDDLSRPSQVIHPHASCPIEWLDWRATPDRRWADLLAEVRARGLDPARAPLMRLTVVRTAEREWRLLWTHHHLILDGWSLPIVLRDVIACYREESEGTPAALPEAPDYGACIRWLARRDQVAAKAYWRAALRGVTQPNEIALPRPALPAEALQGPAPFHEIELELPVALTTALTAVAQNARVTLNSVMQTLWALLVGTYSGQRDVVFGVTVSGRPGEIPDIDRMVGLFINTLPLRVETGGAGPLANLLREVQSRQTAMSQHESSRLVDVHGWSDVPRDAPLFETILVFENYPLGESLGDAPLRDFVVRDVHSVEWTHYPLTCYVTPGPALRLKLVYRTDRFTDVAMRRLLDDARRLGEAMTRGSRRLPAAPDTHVMASERDNGRDVPVHERVRAQAARTPDRVAVLCGEARLTYAELDRRSDALAGRLRAAGVGRGAIVVVSMERSVDLPVALLGVLKAGGAYLPLDPRFPAERRRMMIEDAAPKAVLTSLDLVAGPTEEPTEAILPASRVSPDDLAYLIYTSGSTGRPKGVEVSHGALSNLLASFAREPGLASGDVLVAVTTMSFDIAALEMYLPLITGACLVVASAEEAADGERLSALLRSSGATLLQATPATWRMLLASGWAPRPSLRMWCGGEAMPVDLAERLSATGAELWNVYGPTETTIWSALAPIATAGDARSIGIPVDNTTLCVVDEHLDLVPRGVPGELLIGGAGVARGYRNQPGLTAERFVPDPFAARPGARAYRTGDRVRIDAAGRIEFLGRTDAQVKIRGFRVELGEIEATLRRDRDVRDAAVTVLEGQRLAAYLVLATPERRPHLIPELAAALRERLPDYMIPGLFVDVDALPLTPNGKLDRQALARRAVVAAPESEYVAPRNPLEQVLTDLWTQVLTVDRVGVHDDFFALGGHSLHVAQIVASLRQTFRVAVPLRSVFEATTVERLALMLTSLESTPGRMQHIASALRQLQAMSPEERARLREARRARVGDAAP